MTYANRLLFSRKSIMKRMVIKLIAPLLCLIGLWSCSDDESSMSYADKQWTEKTVAVVLPMEKGLAAHWERTLGCLLYTSDAADE